MRIQQINNIYGSNNSAYNRPITAKHSIYTEQNRLLQTDLIAQSINNQNSINFKSNKFNKNKLMQLCKAATKDNYVLSKENLQNGVFQLDLHSHSSHSDGWGLIPLVMDEAAKYADDLFKKTGKNFTFALTDHDTITGVKEAMLMINSDKKKFEHLNFVPGVELSFAFADNNEVKQAEVLAYFIDPDSKEMDKLIGTLRRNRDNMLKNFVKNLGNGFSYEELGKYFLNKKDDTYAYSLHYRLRSYAQIKNRVNKIANINKVNNNQLYELLMDGFRNNHNYPGLKVFIAPENFDKFLIEEHLDQNTERIDPEIEKKCMEIFPKIKNGKVYCDTENIPERIAETLKDNNEIVLGFAHPYFTAIHMKDFKKGFENLINAFGDKLIFSENYHQAYPADILSTSQSYIDDINKFLLSKNLIPMGGRDNHSPHFIDYSKL